MPARPASHVASLKGVIADEVRFESGLTRFTMGVQARCERLHVQRAARVLVTSRYSGECAQRFYGLAQFPTVVPELIDLAAWRRHLAEFPAPAAPARRFTVLYVGRFYRRKRVNLLLEAAAALRDAIPNLEIRIVGNGPCDAAWRALADRLKLDSTVTWLGDVSRADLAAEYNRADIFCLPSVQEGFGIVLLEAMAAGKPIVAARAAAIPEVAPHAILVDPESAQALAAGILALYRSPEARGRAGCKRSGLGGAVRCTAGGANVCGGCAALPVGQRDRHDYLRRGGLARPVDEVGGAILAANSVPGCRAGGRRAIPDPRSEDAARTSRTIASARFPRSAVPAFRKA